MKQDRGTQGHPIKSHCSQTVHKIKTSFAAFSYLRLCFLFLAAQQDREGMCCAEGGSCLSAADKDAIPIIEES